MEMELVQREAGVLPSMGWLPDLPDFRDYSPEHPEVQPLLQTVGLGELAATAVPPRVDLRPYCSPVEDQKTLGSCTANAASGLIEYLERKAHGQFIDASRLFLYKATRNLLGWSGDTGAYLRTTMAAMALFGAPPERFWPYTTERPDPANPARRHFDTEPPAFCYAFAQSFQALKYFRLDGEGLLPAQVLTRVKSVLAGGFPAMFGFTVYTSIAQADRTGKIPFPCAGEGTQGGHAVLAVGYDDQVKITNAGCNEPKTGALLIRNSWGTGWGEAGYGWLPYEFVLRGLAIDWWTMTSKEFIATRQFGL